MLLILISTQKRSEIYFFIFEHLIDVCFPDSIQSSHKTSLTTSKSLVLHQHSQKQQKV